MINEYKKSLEAFEMLKKQDEELSKRYTAETAAPDEKVVVFLHHIKEFWPLAYAIEQRQYCRERMHFWFAAHQSRRNDFMALYPVPYKGIFGQDAEIPGLFPSDPLDEKVHERKDIFVLSDLEKMAAAVER